MFADKTVGTIAPVVALCLKFSALVRSTGVLFLSVIDPTTVGEIPSPGYEINLTVTRARWLMPSGALKGVGVGDAAGAVVGVGVGLVGFVVGRVVKHSPSTLKPTLLPSRQTPLLATISAVEVADIFLVVPSTVELVSTVTVTVLLFALTV